LPGQKNLRKQEGLWLIDSKKDFEKAFVALQHLELAIKYGNPKNWVSNGYVCKAWQGHMLDLLGRRDEAIKQYEISLKMNSYKKKSNAWFGLFPITNEWLEKRLKEPFKWEEVAS